MGELSEVVKAFVSPAEKLIDAVKSAIGKAYEPRHIRKLADAKAYEIAMVGQALLEKSRVPITYDNGTITMDTTDYDMFVRRTQNRMAFQELNKQKNIETVIDVAFSELDGQQAVTDEPVEPDWILRLFNSVEDISNAQMQQLWGKVLAGEIKRPHSFSLRTLDVLKNLTQKEAALFCEISPFILHCAGDSEKSFYDYFLPASTPFDVNSILQEQKISFAKLILLNEARIISTDFFISVGINVQPGQSESFCGVKEEIVFHNSGDEDVYIEHPAFVLSEAGKELYPIVRDSQTEVPSDGYMRSFLTSIVEKNDTIASEENPDGTVKAQIVPVQNVL